MYFKILRCVFPAIQPSEKIKLSVKPKSPPIVVKVFNLLHLVDLFFETYALLDLAFLTFFL